MNKIVTITAAYNPFFSKLLNWYGIKTGPEIPRQGEKFSFYTCEGYNDQNMHYLLSKIYKFKIFGDYADRSGTIKFAWNWYNPLPWKIPEYKGLNFEETAEFRVRELLSNNLEHYNILYSGGIDSTAVLIAFLKNAERDRFSICYTHESVDEYPELFQWLKNNNYLLVNIENLEIHKLPGKIITGGTGDTAWTVVLPYYLEKNYLKQNWRTVLQLEGAENNLIEFTERHYSISGKSSQTFADLLNFYGLNSYWYNGRFDPLAFDKNLRIDQIIAFYDSPEFESWSYHGTIENMPDVYTSYKQAAKDYIFKFAGHEDYRKYKVKEASRWFYYNRMVHPGGEHREPNFFIDTNGHRVGSDLLPNCTKDQFFERYGNTYDRCFNLI
jgi:hypothetical protein